MEVKIVCILIDTFMVIIFALLGITFIRSKGKGCNYISGYNMKSPKERINYDEDRICKYFGKAIMSWALPFIIGAIIDFFLPVAGVIFASILFIVAVLYHVYQCRDSVFDTKFKLPAR